MQRIRILLVVGLAGGACGGSEPDPEPGPVDPIFVDGDHRVRISEGRWPGVGDPWAGVSARFSDEPELLTETARVGSCRLSVSDVMYCQGCEGFCASGVCMDWAEGQSAGPITITGLAVPLTLTWLDDYYSQSVQPPADLFGDGDAITVTAAGAEVPAFTVSATGVDRIAPALGGACDNVVQLERGADLELTWPDPVPGSRVRLRLPSPTNGHGMPPNALIECEGADTGRLVVPAALVDALPDLHETDACNGTGCEGYDCPPSSLARYTRGMTTAGSEPVLLEIEAEVSFYLFDD